MKGAVSEVSHLVQDWVCPIRYQYRWKGLDAEFGSHCGESVRPTIALMGSWEAAVLPLNYTRDGLHSTARRRGGKNLDDR